MMLLTAVCRSRATIKEKRMRAYFIALTLVGAAAVASAQSRSSFLAVDSVTGLNVAISGDGLTYTLSFDPGAYFSYLGDDYAITDVFGIWALSDDDDLTVTHSDIDVWDAHANNAGGGGIAGWKTNPNTGLTSGQSKVFTFDSLSSDLVERQGFHVRLDGTFPGTEGNTGYITTEEVIPEPMSLLALGTAGAALIAKRRRGRK
jgi:hypothetical protein